MDILKQLINQYNGFQLPLKNKRKPTIDDALAVTKRFNGSYGLAVQIRETFEVYNQEITLERCVLLANRIWAYAYPYYPYKVKWHDECQGYFEIWKELHTGKFYLECEECSTQVDSPEDLQLEKRTKGYYDISVYPTIEELINIDWYKYVIKDK